MAEIRDATTTDVPGILALHAVVAAEGQWIGTEAPVDTARFERLFSSTLIDMKTTISRHPNFG